MILAPRNLVQKPAISTYPPILKPPQSEPPTKSTQPPKQPVQSQPVQSVKSVRPATSVNSASTASKGTPCQDERSESSHKTEINRPCISLIGNDEEYTVEETSEKIYTPTPNHILLLQSWMDCQNKRILLNIGGTKFETCVQTLQNDPSSMLSLMLLPDSPFKPYNTENLYTYFIDRDPRHFVHIINYLRSNCSSDLSTFPRNIVHLRELQKETSFYKLSHLESLLEKRCLDILQGTVDRVIV